MVYEILLGKGALMSERLIHEITEDHGPHYEPFGWHHWPQHPWMSYQFRRALG